MYFVRYHDLLIENEELKQRIEERKNEMSKKENELKEENIYLSDLVSSNIITASVTRIGDIICNTIYL